MKKLLTIIFSLFGMFAIWFAINQPNIWDDITQQNVSSFYPIESCFDGQTVYVTKNYYVWDSFYVDDTHWWQSEEYAYIYGTDSKVIVSDPYNVFSFADSFKFKSNWKPIGVYEVKFAENSGVFLPWSLSVQNPDVNNGVLVAQIAFDLSRQWFHTMWWSANYSMSYWPTPAGPQSTSSFHNYYIGNISSWLECYNYVVHYCGDGDVDTANSIALLQWWIQNSVANEQCDPADPTHQWWWDQWCSNTCEAINQNIQAPTCTLDAVDMNDWSYNINWNINWSFDTPTQINITPTTVSQSTYSVNTNVWSWGGIIPTWYGTYVVSMTVSNAGGSNTCQDSFQVIQDTKVCWDWNIDIPNDLWIDEQCDDGNTNNSDACNSNCQLTTPICSVTVSPTTQTLWNFVTFYATKDSWASYKSFNLDDGNTIWNSNISFPYSYIYSNVWFYDPVLSVENAYSPIAAWVVRPTNNCGVSLDINPAPTDLTIDKILLTTWNVFVGDFVDYKIELTNNADTVLHNAFISDAMPWSLDLISTNLVWVYSFDYNQWQNFYGDWLFEYSWFDLNPWQTVVVNIRWQVRQWASSNETTNCVFSDAVVDCEIYSLSADPYILKSQRVSNIWMSTPFTTGVVNINPGDFITYKIDFANVGGNSTNWWVLVRDYMPLCVDYISSAIYGVSSSAQFSQSQDINGRWIIDYDNFDLAEWQNGYMIVTWVIMNNGICAGVNDYVNNSYIYFNNPLLQRVSNTTAVRATHSIVNLTKTSNTSQNIPWDDKLFVITVENAWPNPISNIVLEDIWPSGTCISYVDRTWVWFTKDPTSLVWTNPITLVQWDSVVLYISWDIANNSSCENPDYINKINLKYTELWNIYEDNTDYHFAVWATPVANISLIKTADVSTVTSWSDITYTISYQNIWNTTLNSYVITDFWPVLVDFVYATPTPTSTLSFVTWDVLQWNFNSMLMPWQTGEIILHWIVQ